MLRSSSFVLVDIAALMSQIYKENKDEDDFLYVTYSGESTFGGADVIPYPESDDS